MNDQKELKRAIDRGNTSEVKRLLEYGRVRVRNAPNTWMFRGYFHHPVGFPEGKRDPPIVTAIKAPIPLAKKKKIITLLLQHGANINSKDFNGFTAIHKAINPLLPGGMFQDHPLGANGMELFAMVRFLIHHGANVNMRSNFGGMAPLHVAVDMGKYRIARYLVQEGANVNSTFTSAKYTPLHFVIEYGKTESILNFVRFLLNHDANPNTKIFSSSFFHPNTREGQKKGWTPLHTAAEKGYPQLVRLLLQRGARPNATDARGMTPLHWAAKKGHSDVVKELLRFGANISATSKNGSLALDIANKKNIKNMIIKERERRRLTAIGSLNRIKKHGTKNTIHVPNNIKFQILSKTGLFNFNNMGPTKKRNRN